MRVARYRDLWIVPAVLLAGLWPASVAAQGTPPDRWIPLRPRTLGSRPVDARPYARLADGYIQRARETGDASYFDRAQRALGQALQIDPAYAAAVRALAFVLYSRHDFDGAAREARRASELNPEDPHAVGILGDACLEVGQYEQAAAAYARMMRLGTDLYALSRRAGLRSLTGDADGAVDDLQQAIEEGRAARRPRESVAWARWQLGQEHFALGNLAGAAARYREALETLPNYHRASAGLAHVRAAQGRYEEAIALYRKALDVVPLPEYAAALGDVYARLGRHDEARKQYALVEYIGRLSALNRVLYNRELAYFYADHATKLPEALQLARKELEVRQDIYAYDLLAWALYRNGKAAEAVAPMTVALRWGTKDARLHFHAGLIYEALGQAELARQHLGRALALNPRFHVLQAEMAERALMALGRRRL